MTEQPKPTRNPGARPVMPVVLEAIGAHLPHLSADQVASLREAFAARTRKGVATYGDELHTENGRDPLWDLVEELLDAGQYVTALKMEGDRGRYTAGDYLRAFHALQLVHGQLVDVVKATGVNVPRPEV